MRLLWLDIQIKLLLFLEFICYKLQKLCNEIPYKLSWEEPNKGTIELQKLLEIIKNMTTEEYNELYERYKEKRK